MSDHLAGLQTVCFACQQERENATRRHWCDERVARADGENFPFECQCRGRHYH